MRRFTETPYKSSQARWCCHSHHFAQAYLLCGRCHTDSPTATARQSLTSQLWAVEANHPDPTSAGIVHVDPNGVTRVRFRPRENAAHIKAFAISVEREGGVQKGEGPIVVIGGVLKADSPHSAVLLRNGSGQHPTVLKKDICIWFATARG